MLHTASGNIIELSDDVVAAENSMRMSSNTAPVLQPDDPETQSSRWALMYSTKETNTLQNLFGLIALNQFNTLKEFIAQTPEGEKRDELLKTLVSMAMCSGTPLRMIYYFIADEMKDSANTAFEPNSDATKIIQFYWEMAGRKYLKDVLQPTINQLTVANKKLSFELDQSKIPSYELDEMPRHRLLVIEHLTQLVERISSKEMISKIPIPVKFILQQINQFGRDRGKYYCGVVLVSRFLCPALADPIGHDLVPYHKFLPHRVRRNFQILASLLRSVMGAHQPEAALLGLSDMLRDFRNQVDVFIDFAMRSKCLDIGGRFINEMPNRPLNIVHKFIFQNQHNIVKQFKDETVAAEFSKGLASLASYQTKWILFFGLEAPSDQSAQVAEAKKVREAIKNWLEQKSEIAVYIGWVDKKTKKGQLVKRVLVGGLNRLATFKPTGKLAREAHLLDLTSLKSLTAKEFHIQAPTWFISGESEEVDNFIACIRRAYEYNFATMPVALKFKVDVQPAARLEAIAPHDRSPSESIIVAYKAACSYLNVPIKQSIITHINQSYTEDNKFRLTDVRTFNLKHMYKHTIDVPTQTDLEPLLFALRHNWFFDTLRIRNHKLEKNLFGQVVEVMRHTSNIHSIILDNTSATKDGVASLVDAMQANKNMKPRCVHIANSPLGDRSVAPLIQYLSTHPSAQFLTKLNLSTIGLTAPGVQSLSADALPKCANLAHLDLSGNKIALATDALVNWALTANCLHTLILSGTSFKTRMLAPALSGSKSLTKLDLSNRRILKKEDVAALSQFTHAATSMQLLVLDRTQLPAEALKDIASNQYTLHVNHNILGLPGIQAIMATRMLEYVKELRLDDTELGDEGVTALCNGLVNHPTLRLLSVARGFKGNEGSKTRITAVQTVAKMLQAGGALEVLLMAGGASTPYQLRGHLGPIFSALIRNTVLTELDISNHHILNHGVVSLSKLIAENFTLSSITWDGNATGTLGFANIKNALKRNLALKYMPVPVADVVAVHKDDRVSQLELQKLSTLLTRIQSYLRRNQQL